jgi:hypothetical protein
LYIVLLYIDLLYIILLYIVLLYIVLLYIVLLYIILLYIFLLYIILLYIFLLYIFLLYIDRPSIITIIIIYYKFSKNFLLFSGLEICCVRSNYVEGRAKNNIQSLKIMYNIPLSPLSHNLSL